MSKVPMGETIVDGYSAPLIARLDNKRDRPFWSIMIPAYLPDENYLRQTLESVLAQDPGRDVMEIEVVDDNSPDVDVAAMVFRIAGDRVNFSRTPTNMGLAGCWNACLNRSKGHWIHILHQDDLVFQGFYRNLQGLIEQNPQVGIAFTRHVIMDSDGHWQRISELEAREPEILNDWLKKLASWQRLECAAVVVKRSSYELVGGYRTDLPYVLDWEMWARLVKSHLIAYSPKILAGYRLHKASESARLRSTDKILDTIHGAQLIHRYVAPSQKKEVEHRFKIALSHAVWAQIRILMHNDRRHDARELIRNSWSGLPTFYGLIACYIYLSRMLRERRVIVS